MMRGRTICALLMCISFAIIMSWTSAVACSTLTVTDDGGPSPAPPYDPNVVNVNGTDYNASQTPKTLNYPNNNPVVAYQYYDDIGGSSAGSRYHWTGVNFTYETASIPEQIPISGVITLPTSGWWELKAFYKLQYQVTFVVASGGTSNPATGSYWYDSGSTIPITANAASGYVFKNWTVTGGVSVSDPGSPATTMTVTGAGSVQATFGLLQYQVTFNGSLGGTTSPLPGSYWYDPGSTVAITATPSTGYAFQYWAVAGGLSVANASSTTTTLTVGGSGSVAPVFIAYEPIDFNLVGVGTDASGTVFTLNGTLYTRGSFNFTTSFLEGTVLAFSWTSPVSAGADKRYVWTSTSGLSTSQSGSITIPSGPGSLTGSYKTQYNITIAAASGGSVDKASGWYDASAPVSITATPSSGYRFTNWTVAGGASVSDPNSAATTMTVTGAGSVQANFELLPVWVSFSQSGIGTDFTGTVVNVDGAPVPSSQLPKAYNWQAGTPHTFSWSSPLTVSAEKRYVWVYTSGLSSLQSGSLNVTNTGSITASYKTQYYASIASGSGGTVNASSGWRDASSVMTVTATPDAGYAFKNWTITGNLTVSDPGSPTATLTVAGSGSVQAVFELLPVGFSFMQSGIGADFIGVVVNVDGTGVQLSELTKTYSWAVGSGHTFSWLSPLAVSANKRYVWTSTSGLSTSQSGTIAVPNATGYVNGSYKTQYYIAIASGAGGTVDMASGFYDASSAMSITATPSVGYAFKGWVTTGSVSVSNPSSAVITMTATGAGTLQATFELLPVGVSFVQSGIGIDFSGAVLSVDGTSVQLSELMKTYSWAVGSVHSFSWLSPLAVSAEKRYVWASTSGLSTLQSGSATTPSGSAAVTGKYSVEYYVTVQSTTGGSTNPATGGWYRSNQTVAISASPSANYEFSSWTTTGGVTVANSTAGSTTFTVSGPGTIKANFLYIPPAVTVTFQSSTGGSTTPSGSVSYQQGSSVPIAASPAPGYQFLGWDVAGNATVADAASASTMLTADGSATVTANFGPSETPIFTVIFTSNEGGSIVPSGSNSYPEGTSVDITAILEPGHLFSTWNDTGDVVIANSTSASTTIIVNGHGTVTAHFHPADSDPSFVANLTPANGTSVNGKSFKISASFSDDMAIDTSSVVLKVDGVEVSGVEVSSSGIAYMASLQPGTHTVELTVKDAGGNPRTVTWSIVAEPALSAISWELFAAIAIEIVAAGMIIFLWFRGRKPVASASQPDKRPVVR